MAVGAQGGPAGDSSSQTTQAHQPGGKESSDYAVVGAQGGRVGDGSSKKPWLSSLGGRGVLPRRRSLLKGGPAGDSTSQRPGHTSLGALRGPVLKEGLQGIAAPYGMGSPA